MGGPFDASEDENDIVSIEYRCSELDSYDSVPSSVATECSDRMSAETKTKKPLVSKNLL